MKPSTARRAVKNALLTAARRAKEKGFSGNDARFFVIGWLSGEADLTDGESDELDVLFTPLASGHRASAVGLAVAASEEKSS